ncbi:hypothetical protein CC78DRAFT_611068 [Lojkania enalia]|uniref:Uncharacterized protein n=1 Tax=Lojkania enalia TaxID=147567 RepID=A0A9P4ND11_9PLEO|nr:hypothetical protein CC78DRAFT_611068 [Didymosphaeria enalia]
MHYNSNNHILPPNLPEIVVPSALYPAITRHSNTRVSRWCRNTFRELALQIVMDSVICHIQRQLAIEKSILELARLKQGKKALEEKVGVLERKAAKRSQPSPYLLWSASPQKPSHRAIEPQLSPRQLPPVSPQCPFHRATVVRKALLPDSPQCYLHQTFRQARET